MTMVQLQKKKLIKNIVPIIVVFFIAYVVSKYYYQFMLIQGESMLPSFHNMQLVVLDKQSKDYRTGDVVAFYCDALSAVLVKRIVACQSDEVQIKGTQLYVNGEVSPIYSNEIRFEYAGVLEESIKLKQNEYIMIGDNVSESKDSRYKEVGIVEKKDIIGRIIY